MFGQKAKHFKSYSHLCIFNSCCWHYLYFYTSWFLCALHFRPRLAHYSYLFQPDCSSSFCVPSKWETFDRTSFSFSNIPVNLSREATTGPLRVIGAENDHATLKMNCQQRYSRIISVSWTTCQVAESKKRNSNPQASLHPPSFLIATLSIVHNEEKQYKIIQINL